MSFARPSLERPAVVTRWSPLLCGRESATLNGQMIADSAMIDWIASQDARMRGLVAQWAGINSGTHHLDGLARLGAELKRHFGGLGPVAEVELPPMAAI